MNSVLGFLSLVLDDPTIPEQHRKYLNTAYASSKSLLYLINDILDLSKLESGRLELENIHFNLHAMLHEIVSSLDFKAREKGLFLNFQIHETVPGNIMGDPGRLKQILINLIDNAVKFTEIGGITVQAAPRNGHMIHFSVADTGMGIPTGRIRSIFEPFTQADASEPEKKMDPALVAGLLRDMMKAFDQYNPAAAEPILSRLFDYLTAGQVNSIKKHVDRFNFKGAKNQTIKLASNLKIDVGIEKKKI